MHKQHVCNHASCLQELPVPLEHAPLVPTAFPRLSQLSLKLDGPLAQTAAALLEACAQAGLPLHTLTIKEEPTRKLTENDQGGEDSIEQRYLSSSGFRHCVPVKYPPVLPAVAKLPHLKSLKLSWMDVEVGTGLTALAPLAGQLTQLCINGNDDNYSFWTEKDVRETIMPGLAGTVSMRPCTTHCLYTWAWMLAQPCVQILHMYSCMFRRYIADRHACSFPAQLFVHMHVHLPTDVTPFVCKGAACKLCWLAVSNPTP